MPAFDAATVSLTTFVRGLKGHPLERLDISIVWVWNPMMEMPGKFNCRIALMREPSGGRPSIPSKSAEHTRETIEDAILAAVQDITDQQKRNT